MQVFLKCYLQHTQQEGLQLFPISLVCYLILVDDLNPLLHTYTHIFHPKLSLLNSIPCIIKRQVFTFLQLCFCHTSSGWRRVLSGLLDCWSTQACCKFLLQFLTWCFCSISHTLACLSDIIFFCI